MNVPFLMLGYCGISLKSDEDAYDRFDDKFYLFKGEDFIMVTTGTTNAGSDGQQILKNTMLKVLQFFQLILGFMMYGHLAYIKVKCKH
jgi:hypothetical protein